MAKLMLWSVLNLNQPDSLISLWITQLTILIGLLQLNQTPNNNLTLTQEERDASKYFHDEIKCFLKLEKREKRIRYGINFQIIRTAYCKTHDILTCHCGFEWGYHGGEDSKALNPPPPVYDSPLCP